MMGRVLRQTTGSGEPTSTFCLSPPTPHPSTLSLTPLRAVRYQRAPGPSPPHFTSPLPGAPHNHNPDPLFLGWAPGRPLLPSSYFMDSAARLPGWWASWPCPLLLAV